jgi:peptidoglycan/xylan/chitin deacetylase (PgdA/CDA1 family)
MKKLLLWTLGAALGNVERSGLFDFLDRRDERPDLLRVLTYHRIAEEGAEGLCPGLVSATPQAFESQLRELGSRYRIVSLAEIVDRQRTRSPLPPRSLLLTFDDAYRDFEENAWPVLERLGVPAALFVPTAYPDREERAFWWDRLFRALMGAQGRERVATPVGELPLATPAQRRRAFARLKAWVKRVPHERAMAWVDEFCGRLGAEPARGEVLGWDALRRLAARGIAICSHTRTHPRLDRIPESEIRAEVRGSLADLAREIGEVLPVFAYPDGAVTPAAVRILAQEGIELAFTTGRGVSVLGRAHPLLLRRVPVGRRANGPLLRAQLLGFRTGSGRRARRLAEVT